MRILRLALTTVVIGALASTVTAAAASLGINGKSLGAGSAAVARCDPDGVTIAYQQSSAGGQVTALQISGVATGCNGASLVANVVDASGGQLASGGAVAVSGGTVTVPLSSSHPAESVRGARIVMVGP